MRTCSVCGKEMNSGYTDEFCFYICEDCFVPYMNKECGTDGWKIVDDDGYDGYFMIKDGDDWHGTGMYWTEWED